MKKSVLLVFQSLLLFCSVIILNSCDGSSDSRFSEFDEHDYPPFFVSEDHRSATLDGFINSNSFAQFDQMLYDHPGIEIIFFDEALGSVDDDVNVQIGKRISDLNLDTHILDNGAIASGAVDLFLAGRNRTKGFNTLVGVHAWSDSSGNEATDFLPTSSVHDFYINYYRNIGMSDQLAEDFYFFTINASESNDLHFMTESETQLYQIFTE